MHEIRFYCTCVGQRSYVRLNTKYFFLIFRSAVTAQVLVCSSTIHRDTLVPFFIFMCCYPTSNWAMFNPCKASSSLMHFRTPHRLCRQQSTLHWADKYKCNFIETAAFSGHCEFFGLINASLNRGTHFYGLFTNIVGCSVWPSRLPGAAETTRREARIGHYSLTSLSRESHKKRRSLFIWTPPVKYRWNKPVCIADRYRDRAPRRRIRVALSRKPEQQGLLSLLRHHSLILDGYYPGRRVVSPIQHFLSELYTSQYSALLGLYVPLPKRPALYSAPWCTETR